MRGDVLTQLRNFFKLIYLSRKFNFYLRKFSMFTHKIQFLLEWRMSENPEYFDHQIDLNYRWFKTRYSYPLERGVFSSFALESRMNQQNHTLDLCCGDGFYAYYFYSIKSTKVTAVDFDAKVIEYAKSLYGNAQNIDFYILDIRNGLPLGKFDNIIWDAAIEHFTEKEINKIMSEIKKSLKPDGILSGYTIVEPKQGGKHLHQHEYEFHDKKDLARFLEPFFKKVQVFSTTYPDRENLYFYATNGLLPFETTGNLIVDLS